MLENAKRMLECKDHQQHTGEGPRQSLIESLVELHSEGIDAIVEKIFETNHPYERGKQIFYEETYFPDAIAIAVEFDRRCQSDTSNDYLIINGYFDQQAMGITFSTNPKEGLGCCFKISGKPSIKRPLVLLGNTIQVEFSSSGLAKDEHSLNRWGFKIGVRPIYGI